MDEQEKAARLAALLMMLRSGGMATMPNANPAALAAALQGPQIEDRPTLRSIVNPAPIKPSQPSPTPSPMIGTRG